MNKELSALCVGLVSIAPVSFAQEVPSHPSQLEFDALEFTPPEPEEFRHELSSGIPVYMAPSDEFPLVTVTLSFKGGAYMEPEGHAGLGAMTGAMIRTGGSSELGPSELDEEFDFMAANVSTSIGARTSSASINALTNNFEEAFDLFMDMVRTPRFDEDRFEVLKGQTLEGLKNRNDDGIQIALREMGLLIWGDEHFEARQPTKESIESISIEDMKDFHDRIFNPANLMVAVTGDFDEQEMLSFLGEAFEGWETGEESPKIPEPEHTPEPGVYYYEKDQPQVQVLIGHRGIKRDNPDAIAVNVMNQILGGAGFTSRITNTVRTREGLAYTAGSVMQPRVEYPGLFMSYFFTQVPTTALATRLVLEEMERIQDEPVTSDELTTIQNNLIETFPRNFESKEAMMNLFISDERTDRPEGYWQNYRDRVRSVSAEDVQEAANEYLHPDETVIMVVGPWELIRAGNVASEGDENRVATMDEFFKGEATEIPQRDPESLEPVE